MSEERKDSLCMDGAALNSLDSGWDYSIELECLQGPEDLQLAAELGKTLLERNKELENSLKQHQNVIEDQTQEIEYLTKQTAALREVNDSRLRIYEQLEVSIQDLERANQRLTLENSADKKHIKSLCVSIDSLETRCEELQRNLDEMTLQQDSYRRRQQRNHSICSSPGVPPSPLIDNGSVQNAFNDVDMKEIAADEEEIIQMLTQMQELRSQRMKEQRKVAELEEQLATMLKDNLCLEEQLAILQQKEADMKSMQEEISTLEEVRQGHLCGRCLRNVDSRGQDELSLLMDHEEEEDASVVNSLASETHRSTVILQIGGSPGHHPHYDNPYRVLVEKYEALVQMQRPVDNKRHSMAANSLSLQEELQMSGDFNSFNAKDNDVEEHDAVVPNKDAQAGKVILRKRTPAAKTISTTPTDFSEAETSSSGFSDETSNKMTQTDINPPPGSFLCTIADGTDCRFSIYDDANPIESRFRKKPQYRQLFREIFDVLKRAAENKDEGEQLPLLDDITPIIEAPKVPPVTPAREDPPSSFPSKQPAESFISEEDTKSIAEELAALTNDLLDSKIKEIKFEAAAQGKVEEKLSAVTPKKSPPKQDILEYLSIGVGIKKKSNGKKNSPSKSHKVPSVAERVERIESPLVGGGGMSHSGRSSNPRKRRESRLSERLADSAPSSRPESPRTPAWYNREAVAATSQQQSAWDFKPFLSSASQEVAKLKRLEKSYAEVLRLQPQPSHRPVSFNGFRRH